MEMNEKAIIFHIGQEDYGIPIKCVISIEKFERSTTIPQLPSYVRGIVKARGELIPVIDISDVLYKKQLQEDEQLRLIVLNTAELPVGILVKETKEIIDIPEESLKQIGLVAYHRTEYFSAIANLEDRLITMIDPERFVSSLDGIKEIIKYMAEQKENANV